MPQATLRSFCGVCLHRYYVKPVECPSCLGHNGLYLYEVFGRIYYQAHDVRNYVPDTVPVYLHISLKAIQTAVARLRVLVRAWDGYPPVTGFEWRGEG